MIGTTEDIPYAMPRMSTATELKLARTFLEDIFEVKCPVLCGWDVLFLDYTPKGALKPTSGNFLGLAITGNRVQAVFFSDASWNSSDSDIVQLVEWQQIRHSFHYDSPESCAALVETARKNLSKKINRIMKANQKKAAKEKKAQAAIDPAVDDFFAAKYDARFSKKIKDGKKG